MAFEIRESRGRPQGRKKLVREREEYLRLMCEGLSSKQACQIVGINERTGKRWRNGRTASAGHAGAPPITAVAPPAGPSRYLGEDERIHIADRLGEKASIRTIATELGRAPSTISREIRRNRHPTGGQYRPHAAQTRANARRPRPKTGKLAANPALRQAVQGRLEMEWSPEQISKTLLIDFPTQPEMQVSHETIYQALYVQGRGELRRELTRALRTGRARRIPRRRPDQRQPRFAAPMVMISERPADAADRAVPGHWEGDLIIGKDQTSQIGTLVERASRYVLLVHLPGNRDAETVRDALAATMTTLPAELKRSLTWDQGSEMSLHHQFSITTGLPIYFCDPHSPWQRGSNENTYWCKVALLGLLRRERLRLGHWVTRRTRAERLSVDMSTAARRARALVGSDLIEAC